MIELAIRKYEIDSSFGWHLLELDRHIHEIANLSAKPRWCIFWKLISFLLFSSVLALD